MHTLSGRTILIADDERYITSALAAKLQKVGANVLVANDGAEAFEVARHHRPEMVLSDYQMPLVSGLELARKLKADPITAAIPIVMLTARGHRLLPSELAATNIRAVLSKPFSVREVMDALQNLCMERAA